MNIVIFDTNLEMRLTFEEGLAGHTITFEPKSVQEVDLANYPDAEVITARHISKITRLAITQLPKLRLIAARSTGYDHIDLEAAEENGVTVMNVPSYSPTSIAEFAFSLLLALVRKTHQAEEVYRTATEDFSTTPFKGVTMEGKAIGIIGTGNIGAKSARIAYGMGMKVIAYDLTPNQELIDRYDVEYVRDLEDLWPQVDFITLHVPANKHTHHLINKDVLDQCRHGVYIVNTARGPVVDTPALVAALESGKVSGAGLDVLEDEFVFMKQRHNENLTKKQKAKLELNIKLRDMKNTIITPHIAYLTQEAEANIAKITIANIKSFLVGNPQNIVKS